jgi:hypothetical protein
MVHFQWRKWDQLTSAYAMRFNVCYPTNRTFYSGHYEDDLCAAEVVRNICVNLGIDPDTVDGKTKNVEVFGVLPLGSQCSESSHCLVGDRSIPVVHWRYNPHKNIKDQLQKLGLIKEHDIEGMTCFEQCVSHFILVACAPQEIADLRAQEANLIFTDVAN